MAAPQRLDRPASEDELVALVRAAAAVGQRVKVVGSGHSFTDIAVTDGRLVRLDAYDRVLRTDPARGTVTVQAGIPLWRLNEELDARGLALPNLGDVAYQTVAGAIATGTHGTGSRLGGLATFVTALRLVTGDGSTIDCSADEEGEVFHAARVGLGALGAVSTVTLQCVPAFRLHAVERPERLDRVLADLDADVDGNDHVELYWVPHTRWALTKRNNRTDAPPSPRSAWREWRDDVLYQNLLFGAACRAGRIRPSWIPSLVRRVPSTRTDLVDASHRVFTSPRLVRFVEMEYAIPRAAAAEALRRVVDLVETTGLLLSFPVEVRFTAADDIPLSMAHGRDTCFIAVHVDRGTPYQQYFEGVEQIMDGYGGRPHWGKVHFQTAATLAPRYPEWEAFQAVRRRLDPAGVFANRHLDRVLGPVDQRG